MNTEKLEKLKKSLDNKFIPDNVKDKIRNEIENLESEIKSEDITATELKKEVAKVEEKVEVAVEKAEKKAESTEPKKGRGRPRKTPTTTPVEPKATETAIKKTAMVVAKTIRKDGEKWNDAMKRANVVMKKEKVEVKKTTKSELDRLLARVRKNKSLMSELKGVKDLRRDAMRTAKPVGKRMSESGNVYYEYRANKTDRKTYGKYAFAGGGKVEFVEKFTYKDGIQISEGKTDDGKIFYSANVISYPLQKIIPMNENKSYVVKRAKDIYKSMLNYKKTEDFKIYGAEKFELGGSVVTDLAGHTGGGNGGFNPRIPLDGFSNTAYTGLVGETGAMSSGEMFMSGGGVAMANQQVIDDASQGYVNYYLGEGASQGIYKDGGAIMNQYKGRTPEEVWNSLSEKQREHFLSDHFQDENKPKNSSQLAKMDYKNIPSFVKRQFSEHISMGQYAKGGGVRKVGNREYSYGRNWTNDQRHVNQSEEHEVNYTRKGKFLGIFAKGGGIFADGRIVLRTFNGIGGNKNKTYSLIKDDRDSDGKPYFTLVEKPSGNIMAQGDDFEEVNNVANIFNGKFMDSIFAKGGGVRQVGNREYSLGRNWTNDHRHTNKSEEHEVNYNRKRFFADGGGLDDDTPKIYVADLEAYNNGRLSGVWLDLTNYSDADELMDAINDFLKTTGGEEYAVHDYENLPSSMYSEYMGVRDFEEIYEMLDLAKENDLPLDVVMEIVSQFDRSAVEEYTGTYDSEQDFAEQLVDDLGGIQNFNDFEYYLDVSDTDRRLLSQEMADSYADDIRDEDGGNRLIEEGGLDVDEYEEADSERQEEMLDEAREIVYDEYYNNWYDGLSDPYNFLVEEQGLYDAESFANANFVRVDYEKLGDALEQDYTFVRHDGQIYVFNIR
jgi:antirestriction protein